MTLRKTAGAVRSVRRNAIAWLALFVALGGTGYAAAQIGPNDIEDNAVRSRHIATGHVTTVDVRDGTLRARDIDDGAVGTQAIRNGRVFSSDIANRNLRGTDLRRDTVTAAEVDESTLNLQGGAPASAAVDGCCVGLENTPSAGDPVAETTITTAEGGRVMATAVVELVTNGGGDDEAFCEINIDGDNGNRQYTQTGLPDGLSDNGGETVSISFAKEVAAGAHTVNVVCFEGIRTSSEVFVEDFQLMAWAGAA